jgi:riboflavin synthase
MFTGIIQAIGHVAAVVPSGADLELQVDAGELNLTGAKLGDSISVRGVCLTVTRLDGQRFHADVSGETLSVTVLGDLKAGSAVNLEPALRAGDALGGHMVSGHVDGIGKLVERHADGRSERFEFEAPAQLARYIARKGSICIDGVSLTVNDVSDARFGVNLVPHTLGVTTLQGLQPGSRVNLEVDLVARYLERLSTLSSNPA